MSKQKTEKELVWERLKYVKPVTLEFDFEAMQQSFVAMGRSAGKSMTAMQAVGRVMRNKNEDI